VKTEGLETCLYTGYDNVSLALREQLTYLKTGPWIAARGGLESPITNQRFYDLRTQQLLNCEFQTGE
jgi:anaerobic ribonucleoside-triphosphate reductase activating protein